MSRLGRVDQLWLVGGVLGAAVLLAITWFLLVSPQHSQRDSLQAETASAELRLTKLKQRIGELRKQNDQLDEYKRELAQDRQALPATSGLSDLLRELQVAGDTTGVSVGNLNVGNVAAVTDSGGTVFQLPLSMTVTGDVAKLSGFLDQLQVVQPRALLVNSCVLTITNVGANLAITMQAFVAPDTTTATAPSTSASASASPSTSSSSAAPSSPGAGPTPSKNG
jgi:Tfp pilus assembly protein PilO